jgi:hypothetical protein
MLTNTRQFRRRGALALVATAAVLGTAVAAQGTSLDVRSQTAFRYAPAPVPTQADLRRNVANFHVLAERRGKADVLPRLTLKTVTRGATHGIDVSAAHARRVAVVPGQSIYLIPGKKWICLKTQTGAGACNFTRTAADGYLLAVLARFDDVPEGVARVMGAMPDGVESVALELADGRVVVTAVRNNVYVFDVDSVPRHLHFTDRAGKPRTIDVPYFGDRK